MKREECWRRAGSEAMGERRVDSRSASGVNDFARSPSRPCVLMATALLWAVSIGCDGASSSPATNGDSSTSPSSPTTNAGKSNTEAPAGGSQSSGDASNGAGATPSDGAASGGGAASTDASVSRTPSLWTRKNGSDWPSFLGPTGDSKSPETGILTQWPMTGPRIVWQREAGEGYGIGSISRGRFFQFDRFGEVARLDCLHAETGELIWKFEYPTDYVDTYQYNGGPRASPVIDDDRVYILGVDGQLYCLDVLTGKPLWNVDTVKKFGVIQNFFGVGSTPCIEGDLLLVMVGGSPDEDQSAPRGMLDRVSGNGSGIVAFDKRTGEVKYQITDELASYASMRVVELAGRRTGLAFCRGGLVAFDPRTGKVDFQYPWRTKILESVNASTPVVVGNEVFISETYGVGSSLLNVKAPGEFDVVWSDDPKVREKAFKAHWNTPIFVDGNLYGCSGRNPPDAELRCIEWKTGKVMWTVPNQIRTSLLHVDGHFVCLGEFGHLELIKVNPEKYEPVAEVTLRRKEVGPAIPGLEPSPLLKTPCWAAPILSHGLLYVRGDDRLVCLELIPEAANP